MGQLLRHYSLLVLGTNTALYGPSTPETTKQFPVITAIIIGLVAYVVWRQTSSLKGFGYQKRCMASGTFGLLVMEIALFTTAWSLVYHHNYGRKITKVECANHAVKCYRNRLEALCNDKHGLSQAMMKRNTHGARCAIKMHNTTGDVAALRHDLRNGP